MNKKLWSQALLILLLPLLIIAYPASAQDQTGIIRGTVYRDANDNGLCSDEGEARLADVPLEIINDELEVGEHYITASDGTYVHNDAFLGLWQVTVVPGVGWRVTSQQTLEILLTEEDSEVSEVDFCIVEVESPPDGGVTLPESGGIIAPQLLIAGLAGLLLMTFGAGFMLNGRKSQKHN